MLKSRKLLVLYLFSFLIFTGCSHLGDGTRKGFTWSPAAGPINAGHYRCVAVGDLNNDGFQDIAAGSFNPGGITIWTGNGAGKWRRSAKPGVIGDVRTIAIGDLNGDGLEDLVAGGQRDLKGVVVLLQEVSGTWRKGISPAETGSYDSIKCMDMNQDGNLDIIAANSSGDLEGGIQVWFGNGKGDWTQQAGPDVSHIYRDLDIADIDNDGNLDIVATSWGHPGGIRVFLGSGDGAWSALPGPAGEGDFWGVTASDLNDDGMIDIAATTYYQGIKIWYGDGKGHWDRIPFSAPSGFYWDLLAADLNRDGRTDLAASSVNSKGIRVWLGQKVGGWISMNHGLPETGGFYGMTHSDLDGDGYSDLVAASYSQGVNAWFGGMGKERTVGVGMDTGTKEKIETGEPYMAVTRFGIPFEENGTDFSKSAQGVIAELLNRLQKHPYERIRIEGYAASHEKPEQGESLMTLSEKRAEKVGQLLNDRLAMPSDKITVTGFADSKAMGDSMTRMGVKNSRADVSILHYRSVDDTLEPDEDIRKRQDEFIKTQSMSEYRVGPGDILKIIFWKQFSADEYEILIRPDGTLSFSMVDDLKVSELTVSELENVLTKELSRYIKNPRIDIVVKEFHSQEVLLLGAINSLNRQPTGPGVYILSRPTRIVELLTIAGGPRPTANLKKVAVTRKNGTTLYINIYKAIFQSDATQDIPIYAGDSIFIPEASEGVSKVYVFGEVKNPGIYDLKEGMSVLEAVGKAGSFSDDAVMKSTRLIRGDLARPDVIPVDVSRFFRTGDLSDNLMLQNNDIIYVPKQKIASVAHFLKNFKPMLDMVLWPYQFESLRTNIDLNEKNVRPLAP